MRRAAVTGAAGFIGAHVARALAGDGHEVRALHLPGEDLRNLAGLPVERRCADVSDRAALCRAFSGCDWVFHLAAVYSLWDRDAEKMRAVNVLGAENVFSAAAEAGVARVVYTSSIARFGGQGRSRRATEESPFALGATGDVYSETKRAGHEAALRAARLGQDIVIVAPTGPIGPGDIRPTPTGRLLLALLSLPAVAVVDSMSNVGDVRDIARGHVLAAERGLSGESYLLGNEDLSLEDLARRALEVAGLSRPVLRVPLAAAGAAARLLARYADLTGRPPALTPAAVAISALGLRADCSKAFRALGLPARPIEESLRDALAWFAENGYIRDPGLRRSVLSRLKAAPDLRTT
jgi:dihydroflavonol-4-reductase